MSGALGSGGGIITAVLMAMATAVFSFKYVSSSSSCYVCCFQTAVRPMTYPFPPSLSPLLFVLGNIRCKQD